MMRSLLLTAVLVTMSGCASSPQAKFYTLSAVPPSARAETATPVGIALDSVTVPDLVDRPQFVVRIDATQVKIDEYARWAEPLKSQISRVLVADLAQSVPGALVSSSSQWVGAVHTYHVSVDVQSFESALNDTATIAVLWTVRPPKPGTAVNGRTIVHEPTSAPGYDALVDAHNRALASVSSDIAGAIRSTLRP
ncbi:lipoprotein [Caballeronia arationis]|uniref:Uncharacterized lipoprotein YmbA n=1 Tax=Caballeronia arationis TaxID=1777142 RepID=A0A7Z7N150_9BURK|nr:PqiC family protein [Caballeronia arationis]SAL06443.1 lipoprotein [Caballeronia arationis]SOE56606.1 Uncharacterized lipoprotein YmbA [Caballeronia arationis]